jgi:hypothetical protein
MRSDQQRWQYDWQNFVETAAAFFGEGKSAREVTEHFAGRQVVWTGTVLKNQAEEAARGIRMDIPPVDVALPDGRYGTIDFVALRIDRDDVPKWQGIKEKTVVRFQCTLSWGNRLFAGLNWSDVGDGKGYIGISTERAVPVEIFNK